MHHCSGQECEQSSPSVTYCLALESSTGKLLDPHLPIHNQTIPFIGSGSITFVGMTIQVPTNQSEMKSGLKTNLEHILKAVDAAPVTRCQKLYMAVKGWYVSMADMAMTIQELPITWVEQQLEATATRFMKKWAGLAKSANTALLYLPQRMCSLNLPSYVCPLQAAPSLMTVPATDIS